VLGKASIACRAPGAAMAGVNRRVSFFRRGTLATSVHLAGVISKGY